jgi:hypothetical protein
MALIVEDGTIVANANSYISETEYQAWADARFSASRSTAPVDDAAAEVLILRAMDYFETLDFQGSLEQKDQPLQWPRSWVVIDGYAPDADSIPKEVKNSLYELTYAEELGEGYSEKIDRKVESETIGPISVTYSSSSSERVIYPSISRWLKKLLRSGGGLRVNRV